MSALDASPAPAASPLRPLRFGPLPNTRFAVELHETAIGSVRQPALDDHHISVHSGVPVRMSCHDARVRCLRTRGEITLTPPGQSDEWLDDDASHAVDLRLSDALLREVALGLELDPDRARVEPHCSVRDARIEHIAWALEAESRAGFPSGALYTEALGTALAVHLLSHYRQGASGGAPRGGPKPGRALSRAELARVTEHVEAHLSEELSLSRLARVAGVSPSHFKSLFKHTTGLPPHTYVIRRRVERARALLEQRELPTSQIALEVGFSHQSHLARWMRRLLGVTPSELRRGRDAAAS